MVIRTRRSRVAAEIVAQAATVFCLAMACTGTLALVRADASVSASGPTLTLEPAVVPTPGDSFSLRLPPGSLCEEDGTGTAADPSPGPRSGADNWRWHAFIVEAGRDLSSMTIGPPGPGADYDASDGAITAVLLDAQRNRAAVRLPALRPKGMINPDEISGLVFDPNIYTLVDGQYDLHVACTDETNAIRQLWSVTVDVRTDASPFLSARGSAAAPGGSDAADRAPDGADIAAPTERAISTGGLAGSDGAPTAASPAIDEMGVPELASTDGPSARPASGGSTIGSPQDDGATASSPTPAISSGRSFASLLVVTPDMLPVGVWVLFAAVMARISYLLAVPVRVLPPVLP